MAITSSHSFSRPHFRPMAICARSMTAVRMATTPAGGNTSDTAAAMMTAATAGGAPRTRGTRRAQSTQ